jgi:hypothetical protein
MLQIHKGQENGMRNKSQSKKSQGDRKYGKKAKQIETI